ncbi:MAG: carbohydrate ABC transporter permease, partial [Spirochaetota bacterium]
MKKPRNENLPLEILTAVLFVVFIFPFFIVLINSAKGSFEITSNPMGLPSNWGIFFTNIATIWTSVNIQYQSSFIASIVITAGSLVLINLLSAQAAWALVRTKSRTSSGIFLVFIAAMVIPFQIVMFPLLTWFRAVTDFTGIPLLRNFTGIFLAYVGFGMS